MWVAGLYTCHMIVSTSPVLAVLSALAALAYGHLALRVLRADASPVQHRRALLAAWVLHAICLGWPLLTQSPLRFGFAPALSMTAWLVLSVYWVEKQVFPKIQGRWVLAVMAAASVVAAAIYPGKLQPMDGTGALAMHWALGLAAYGMFGAAVVHAWLMRQADVGMRSGAGHAQGVPLLGLERLMFRFIGLGFVMLSATLLGGWWISQGEVSELNRLGWRWDHKTVFSLLAWLVFAVLLLGRLALGWRGRRATGMVFGGSVLLLLAYVGSRFVLEVVLRR